MTDEYHHDAAGQGPPSLCPSRQEWRWLAVLLAVGLVLRIAMILAFQTYEISPKDNHYLFGHEYGRIARSLAVGKGYASPYAFDRGGPTTKGSPLFAYYLALLFRVFGIYSPGAAAAMHVTNSVASVVTALFAFIIGKRLFGTTVAWTAAVLFLFDPSALWYSTNLIWESSLSAAALAGLMVTFIWLHDHLTLGAGAVAGLVAGFLVHIHIGVLPVCAVCALWLLIHAKDRRGLALRALGAMAFVGAVTIAPWSVRNSLIEGQPVILRGNYMAIVADVLDPEKEAIVHESDPGFGAYHRKFDRLGQRGVTQRALERIRSDEHISVERYLRDVGIRSVRFWIGDLWRTRAWYGSMHIRLPLPIETLKIVAHSVPAVLAVIGFALARHRWGAWLLFAQVAGFFPMYALLHCRLPRYRYPIHATLLVLCACALRRPVEWATGRLLNR